MLAYQEFVELSGASDSQARSRAAHFAALAFVEHSGPADEQAALYAAIVGFLDDHSVKVRAALAYGLLRAKCAPRPVMVSLLHDAPVIARAVAQFSPVLVDADLFEVIKTADQSMLEVIVQRPNLSVRVAQVLVNRDLKDILLLLLARHDVELPSGMLDELAATKLSDPEIRGALLSRKELSAVARYQLIEKVRDTLANARIVKGSVAPNKLGRLLRDATDTALTSIGEREVGASRDSFAEHMVSTDKISLRLLLHAITQGHVLFFARCLGLLAEMPHPKVFAMLNHGSPTGLAALFSRCGMSAPIRLLMARFVQHARESDLADDLAARHFVVTALIDEMLEEHNGDIPAELEEAFGYLNEQNITLARHAARGVLPAFAEEVSEDKTMLDHFEPRLVLPAA